MTFSIDEAVIQAFSSDLPVGHGSVLEPRVVAEHDVIDLRQVLDQH